MNKKSHSDSKNRACISTAGIPEKHRRQRYIKITMLTLQYFRPHRDIMHIKRSITSRSKSTTHSRDSSISGTHSKHVGASMSKVLEMLRPSRRTLRASSAKGASIGYVPPNISGLYLGLSQPTTSCSSLSRRRRLHASTVSQITSFLRMCGATFTTFFSSKLQYCTRVWPLSLLGFLRRSTLVFAVLGARLSSFICWN